MWGMHLTVDVANCNENRSAADAIARFAKDMVERINMKAYGEPWIVHFAKENPQAAGYTLTQLIETSNITAHFCDHSGECYFDVFSCMEFDVDAALDVIADHFGSRDWVYNCIVRQAPEAKQIAAAE
ncbi:S-adenosylmethionine decarboxylase [Rhodospirillales bacterium]|jgi:S-adenosylmethionine/arginine decarboxylase-like enzyme|nr:S-adenosylmethionine decarboxylase [Rhodospirillales bacterium]